MKPQLKLVKPNEEIKVAKNKSTKREFRICQMPYGNRFFIEFKPFKKLFRSYWELYGRQGFQVLSFEKIEDAQDCIFILIREDDRVIDHEQVWPPKE